MAMYSADGWAPIFGSTDFGTTHYLLYNLKHAYSNVSSINMIYFLVSVLSNLYKLDIIIF